MASPSPVIFTHIPKTGGTSLRELLYRAAVRAGLDDDRIHIPGYGSVDFTQSTMQLSEDELAVIRARPVVLLADHGKYGIHERLGIADPFYFTMLRDPVSSLVSDFYFMMQQALVERVEFHRDEISWYFGDEMLASLDRAGEVPDINRFPRDQIARYSAEYRNPILFFLDLPSDRSGVAAAKKRLRDDYRFFGLQERFEESVARLREVLPEWVRLPEEIPHRNRNRNSVGRLSDEVRRIIENDRALDLEIYEYARREFENARGASYRAAV